MLARRFGIELDERDFEIARPAYIRSRKSLEDLRAIVGLEPELAVNFTVTPKPLDHVHE